MQNLASGLGGATVQHWSPHMNFIMKGSQISALQFKGWFKSKTSIQEYRNEIQKSYQTCAWIIWYMFLVQCDESRINHLTLLLEVTIPYSCWFLWQHITLRTSSDIFIFNSGLHFEGLFWERYILKSKIAFNLEQWVGVPNSPPRLTETTLVKWESICKMRIPKRFFVPVDTFKWGELSSMPEWHVNVCDCI